jgi:hypothetical protein
LALRSSFIDRPASADTNRRYWIADHPWWFVPSTGADWIAPVARRATTMGSNVVALLLAKLRNSARMFGVGARFSFSVRPMSYFVHSQAAA